MQNSSFISDSEYLDFAPVTFIDRYNWNGEYLDRYTLPDSCINIASMLPEGILVVRNFQESCLKIMEITECQQ